MVKKGIFNSLKKLINKEPQFNEKSNQQIITIKEQDISTRYEENLEIFKSIFSIPKNTDVKIREFTIRSFNRRAFILFIGTMVNGNQIQNSILKPLIENDQPTGKIENIVSYPIELSRTKIGEITEDITSGNTTLFVEGDHRCYVFATTEIKGRSIEKSDNEVIVRGAKEAFNEKLFDNVGLIRKKIKNENLIVEHLVVTQRSRNDVLLVYEKDLADDKLLQSIKKRIDSIDADSVIDLSILEQYLEERPRSLFPTILNTERPDRAVSFIEEGHVVLLMSNSPNCLVLPATFWSLFHSPEDHYLRTPYGNFIRLLRFTALFISMFASGIYIALTNYHVGMIPPDLLMAIAGTRERVPFPSIIEILMMELAFELIREAGLRVPSPIGPTIGIVGALILGQAAVQANIISPIVIIVIALSGLSSFIISDTSLNFAIRISRFLIIFSAGFMGIYGMGALITLGLYYLASIQSFGVPYFAPFAPHTTSSKDLLVRPVPMKLRFRPGYIKPKDMVKQGKD